MNKRLSFGMSLLLALILTACGASNASNNDGNKSSKPATTSVSQAPKKSVKDISISLGNDGDKAYITVRGTQSNYSADEFKWAWGLKSNNGSFDDGKAKPADDDYVVVPFNSNNEFTVRYCLTDIQTIKAGTLYRIYGGTPETYGEIAFESNMFGANDATRKYYLRVDKDNSLVFENVQPLTYDQVAVVEVKQEDLPDGVTEAGAYLKFGGKNSKNLTVETINSWHEGGNIAGNFQRVIPSWQSHDHVDSERFWIIEGNYVYFYLYVGFIEVEEGWMTHFDLVSGNSGAGLQLSKTVWGETSYTVNEKTYKVYADTSKSTEEEYWGCVGVYRVS